MGDRIQRYIQKLKTSFGAGFVLGAIVGAILALITEKLGSFVVGVVLGVVLEQLILGTGAFITLWRSTHPIKTLFGTIASDEDVFIFFSSFYRDLSKPGEFRLLRADTSSKTPDKGMVGPVWVLGEGDATAISLVQGLLTLAGKKPTEIRLERSEKHLDRWGISSVCIGAHNPRTRVLLSKSASCSFIFDLNYSVISKRSEEVIDGNGDQLIKRGVFMSQSADSEPTDYGIVARISDPFHANNKTIFVIAGLGPAGTAGAAYFLSTNFQELSKLKGDFSMLIQVPSGYQSARKVEFDEVADYYGVPKEE